MNRIIIVLAVAMVLAPLASLGFGDRVQAYLMRSAADEILPIAAGGAATVPAVSSALVEPAEPLFRAPGEARVYEDAVEAAWAYVDSQYQPATGLVNSVLRYPFATVWDIGSGLAALYCARELDLIEPETYRARMRRALLTLQELPLHDGTAFNKNYQVARAAIAGRNDRDRLTRPDGYGWSAVDLGRLLVWLKIVAEDDPSLAREARAVVERLDMDRLVRDGYLQGAGLDRRGRSRSYQEGRIGYEQYAAAGFALWGARADGALNWDRNVQPVEVLGVPLLTDRRPDAYLTSEPFLLLGLELGWWDDDWRTQAERVLAAQEARFRETGEVTMVSEDAVPVGPHYFYYYTVRDGEEDFAVRALGSRRPDPAPRWVSAKAAYAWHALMPDAYTWRAVEAVSAARDARTGWSSGVYEGSGRATGSHNINTAAVVLEAAVYRAHRRPLLSGWAPE